MNLIGKSFIYIDSEIALISCIKYTLKKGDKITVIDSFYCNTNGKKDYLVKVNSKTHLLEDADNGGFVEEKILTDEKIFSFVSYKEA